MQQLGLDRLLQRPKAKAEADMYSEQAAVFIF